MIDTGNILEVDGISKRYKSFCLEDISFSLPAGFIMGLVGPNGAGKTTIIKSIINAINIDGGTVRLFGRSVREDEIKAKEMLGYISDENYFWDDWTAKDVGMVMSKMYPSWDGSGFAKYIDDFGLPLGKPIKDYSSGMKTRLMLAAVFCRDTRLLILDEPTSGLDPVMRDEFLTLIKKYISDGERSVLYSTHITTDLEKTADFITFISGGKMVFSQEMDALKENYFIIKDSLEKLDDIKSLCIGIRENEYGFEALVTRSALGETPSSCVRESATIDDIVVFHSMKGEKMI